MHENGFIYILLSSSEWGHFQSNQSISTLAHENTVELFIERVQCIQFVRIKCNVNKSMSCKSKCSYNVGWLFGLGHLSSRSRMF